ncbi:MAG: hypothetical protein U0V02_21000 [Anaerolineales bacterium]
MKHMNDFHKWLSSSHEVPASDRRRLIALTRLERSQLASMSSLGTWFVWNAEQTGVVG